MNKLILSIACIAFTSCLTEAKKPAGVGNGNGNALPAVTGDASLGLATYEDKCASCHNSIADSPEDSQKAGASFDRIAGAGSVAAHSGIDPWLDEEESANVAAALDPNPSLLGDVGRGISIFEASCSCHGTDPADSPKSGRSLEEIEASADIASHSSVSPFPSGQDLADLAAALNQ